MSKPKPKILVIGHARHGKDHFAGLIANALELKFTSSSEFVGKEILWENWGQIHYTSFDEMFEDRVNHRELWADMISEYNNPDKTKTATTMLGRGNHMYVGMRRRDELEACKKAEVFDLIIWVDGSDHRPDEDPSSMELKEEDADVVVFNNVVDGDGNFITDFSESVYDIAATLSDLDYDVGNYNFDTVTGGSQPDWLTHISKLKPKLHNRLSWEDKPVGATTVLDHGFIQVKEVMGNDKAIVDSARMSYGRGTKSVNKDAGLINYLVNNHHTSPLEMGEIRFHIRMPIFVARQWIRHRTANVNEYSGRYSQMVRLFYVPKLDNIKGQHTTNKQMSEGNLTEGDDIYAQDLISENSHQCFDNYEKLLGKGVSRETARIVLPLNTYTEVMWKLDISNLLKFLYLRDDPHSQWEIQQFAKEIAKAVEEHFPLVYNAYMRQRGKVSLTQDQLYAIVWCTPESFEVLSKSEAAQVHEILAHNLKVGTGS